MDTYTELSWFLYALYGDMPSGYIEVRLLNETTGEIQKLWRTLPLAQLNQDGVGRLQALNEAGYHIYFRVAISDKKRSRKQDINYATALWFDIDASDSTDFLELHGFEPHMLVRSGSGYHGYYLLDEPLDVQANRKTMERALSGIARCFGGDGKVKDVTRILRLPGFYNVKPKYGDTPPRCEIVYLDIEPTSTGMHFPPYRFDELYDAFAPYAEVEKPQVKRELPAITYSGQIDAYVQKYLDTPIPEGERNSWLFNTALHCNGLGMSQMEAESLLMSKALSDGLAQHEAGNTIRSAYARSVAPVDTKYNRLQAVMALEDAS